MASFACRRICLWVGLAGLALGQNCYYGPGSKYQVSGVELVPCLSSGFSSCCLAGDTCLAGNACFNEKTGDTYQYGCTDITYQDASCPFKCGWSPNHSPWIALEYCTDIDGVDDTWVCHSPESCGCSWRSTYELLVLPPRGCKEMGSLARVGAYGPTSLQPYASLPSKAGGSTGYFSPTTISGTATVVSTPIDGYTPKSIGPITYATPPPREIVKLNSNAAPAPRDGTALLPNGSQPPIPITGVLAQSSSFPPAALRGSTSALATGTGTGTGTPTGSGGKGASSTGSSSGSSSTGGSSSNDNDSGGGGLTTGAKVGLGVGIAGGVCLIAAIILTAVVLRKRKQPSKGPEADPDYMQGYQDKTHDSYASTAPVAGYYDPHFRDSASPGLYEAPQTPAEEEIAHKRMSPQGPQELAGSQVHEMESRPATPAL